MKKFTFIFLLGLISSVSGWAQCSDLYFSEYIEGSSNNKGVEVYNPTNVAVDLSDYQIYELGNGGAFSNILNLTGMLAPGDVYVVTTDQADSIMQAQADTVLAFPSVVHFNGDDAVALVNLASGDTIDLIGVLGVDPGSEWPVDTGSTKEHTLVRMASVQQGTTDWAVGATEWVVYPQNTYDYLGSHTMNPCGSGGPTACAVDLFFSEYIEGSSNNKGVEIYNPFDTPVDLSDYQIYELGNGGSFFNILNLTGMLAPGDVYVVTTDQADSIMQAQADTVLAFPSVVHFNGDDAVALVNLVSGDTVDLIGVLGVDPGSEWPVDTGSTKEHTLVRMASVQEGTADWAVGATQWIVYPQNTYDYLGSHSKDPCPPSQPISCAVDLFFSEYIEGSSNNKGVEIYNPFDTPVDLSDYQIYELGNGGSFFNILNLTGMLAPGDVYVVTTDQADSIMQAQADTVLAFPSVVHFNGDDAVALVNLVSGDTVDLIGELGIDPGSEWPVDTGSTKEHTLVRMASVQEGTADWAVGATQWIVYPQNTYDYLGSHSKDPCSPVEPACTVDLFISEYIEGSGNNKGIEIYNPLDSAIDLSNYQVYELGNGGSFFNILNLTGMLAPGDVYVITTDQADSIMQAQADTVLAFPSIVHFNGDDAVALVNLASGDTVDIIGELGIDPGSEWTVGSGSTKEYTLVRSPYIQSGTTDWTVGSTQWLVFPQNTFDSLGSHFVFPCGTMPPPAPDTAAVSFASATGSVWEYEMSTTFDVNIADFGPDTVEVDVVLNTTATTATNGVDFSWNDTTIVFPDSMTTSHTLTVGISDDTDIENDEVIVFDLVNATSGANIGTGTLTITLQDDDYPIYPIDLVTNDSDGDGLADSLDVKCQIQGIVHGIDMQGGSGTSNTNVQFTVIDSTGGITIFSGNDYGYTVTEGDDVIIQGTLVNYNGLVEFSPPDTIILVSQGNPTFDPTVVTTLDEASEAELVTLECVTIIDTTQWPSSVGGSANINVTNGIDTFSVRIDSDVALNGTPVPTAKWLNITGIGGQFISMPPYTSGYQLLPQFITDVAEKGTPEVGFDASTAMYDESDAAAAANIVVGDGNPDTTTITIVVDPSGTATQGTDYSLSDTILSITDCGDHTIALPLGIIDDTDIEGDETVVLIITSVTNATISIDTVTVTITETDAISDLLPASAIKLYPNPAKVNIRWESELRIEQMTISNLLGQEIVRKANPDAFGQMDISTLPKGLYIIRMETDKGVWTKKWMKE